MVRVFQWCFSPHCDDLLVQFHSEDNAHCVLMVAVIRSVGKWTPELCGFCFPAVILWEF